MEQTEQEKVEIELAMLKERQKQLQRGIPKKTKRRALPQSISEEDFEKIVSKLKLQTKTGKKFFVAILLAYQSGLRISEVIKLKKEDININQKSIFIREGKYSRDRVVPLPSSWKNSMLDFIPFKYKNVNAGIRALQIGFKRRVKMSGVNPKYHFHSLRHSFGTRCLEKGMPINQVQILLGHSSVATTNVYIQANPVDALNKYQEIFK